MHPQHRATRYTEENYTPVDLSTLRFATGKDTDRFLQLRRIFLERTDSPDWMRMEPFIAGNFVEEYWVNGPNSEHIVHGVGGGWKKKSGMKWYVLGVMTYDLPDVFGLKVHAGSNPDSGGWGVDLSYANMDLMGSISASLSFPKWEQGRIIDRIQPIGHAYQLPEPFMVVTEDDDGGQSETDMIEVRTDDSVEKVLRSIFKSERSFMKHALSGNKELRKNVEKAFATHFVKKQIFEEYKNDGIPPEYTLTDLDGGEEERLLEEARRKIRDWNAEIQDHSEELYSLLMALAPFNEVWK